MTGTLTDVDAICHRDKDSNILMKALPYVSSYVRLLSKAYLCIFLWIYVYMHANLEWEASLRVCVTCGIQLLITSPQTFFFLFLFFCVWVLLWVNVIQKKTGDCCTCKKHCNAVVGCCDDAPLHEFRPQYRRSDEQQLVRNIRAWHASSQMSSKRSRTRGACSHARYVLQSEHKSAFFFFFFAQRSWVFVRLASAMKGG